MDYKCRIDRIIERARRLHMPLGNLARQAGISPSTLYRWRQPAANPGIRRMNRVLDDMEQQLHAEIEALRAEIDNRENPS